MNLKKKIEQPLREKILINEERIRSLFNFKLDDEKTETKDQNNSIEQSDNQMKKESMEFEILSKSNMNKSQYNNSSLNSKLNNDNLISISISTRNNESLSSINNKHKNKIKQRNPINSNIKVLKKSDKGTEKISNTINYNYNYSYNNYNNNNYNFTITTRKNKNNIIQSMGLKNLKNNETNHNYYSNISNLSQYQPLFYSIKPKQSVNLNKMFERFEENEKKKKEKIEKLKREKEEKELEQCFYKPLLNKKSLDINKKIKDDFLTRQKNYNQKVKEKEKKIVRDLSKKKEKTYLSIKKNKESSCIVTDFLNTSLKSEGSYDQKTINVNDTINKLYEWEQRRKEKIEKKREEKECEKEDSGDHIPTIGKRSSSLANRRKVKKEYTDNIFERLYKEDDILKEKRELMVQLTKPSFEPNLNLARKYKFEELTEEKYINDITHYYNNEFVNEIIAYMNKNIMSPNDKISNKDLQDDEIKQLYRKAIIEKMRKNFRMKSEEKRKPKKYHHM